MLWLITFVIAFIYREPLSRWFDRVFDETEDTHNKDNKEK